MAIEANVLLTCTPATLGGLRSLLEHADKLGGRDTRLMLDGGHAHIQGHDTIMHTAEKEDRIETLGDLRTYVQAHADMDDEVTIIHGETICIELPLLGLELISCGEHSNTERYNILLTLHPDCENELAEEDRRRSKAWQDRSSEQDT